MKSVNLKAHLRYQIMEQTDTDQGRGEEDDGGKRGKGLVKKTCVNDPRTWTAVWGLTVGVGGWDQWKRVKGEILGKM